MSAVIRRVAVVSALICIVTAAMALLYDPWAATAVGVVWVTAAILIAARFRPVEDVAVTPPPPRHHVDKAIVLAAITGRPLNRAPTIHERYQIAVISAWQGKDVEQIAANVRCSEAEVAMLLAIRPLKSAIRR